METDNRNFEMVAKTFGGLEDVLRDELISIGARDVEMGNRMVSFTGDLRTMYRANLCSRTALRILKPIIKFTADDPDELYDYVRDLDWEQFMDVNSTFAIDSTVNSPKFTHSRFVTYRVKDGIADHFFDKYQRRPSIRLDGADIILNVHIDDNRVTISLDSSGEPLNKRGYRVEQTAAPINEVLAAGIILKTGWRGDSNFVDPMCGSGTFLIEAALIANNINPGIYREHFAFEKWKDFDEDLFEDIYNDDTDEREFAFKIYGGDIDPEAVAIARKNIRAARMEDYIDLACRDIRDWTDNPEPGIMVTNPPYGERLKPDDMGDLYRGIGSTLKRYFSGWNVWILGYRDEHFQSIGLKPSVKIPMLNGDLECSLREYVLFDGKYSEFRQDGGSVANEKFNREEKARPRRMKDKEWETETRKFGKKPFAKGGDRKVRGDRDFKRRDDRDFKRRDDRDFKRRDDRDFKRRDDRDFKRRDNRDFKRRDDRDFKRRDDRDFKRERPYRPTEAKTVQFKGPRLPEDSEIKFADRPLRSRKRKNIDDNRD